MFVGRTDDAEAQTEALRLLRVPTGVGYEPLLSTPAVRGPEEPRRFVFADGTGDVEAIRVDLSAEHLAHVRAALDTNPDAARRAGPAVPVVDRELPTWPGEITPPVVWEAG